MSYRPRVIPCLLLKNKGLVKTIQFKNPKYIGDPINAVKIFNEKEVDEFIFLDIQAQINGIQWDLLKQIVDESMRPFSYGGGIQTLEDIHRLVSLGLEKVIINRDAFSNPGLIYHAAKIYGSQSICISMDVKKNIFNDYKVYIENGKKQTKHNPIDHAKHMQESGAGEIMLTSIKHDGMMNGYDLELIKQVSDAVSIPVTVCGGAGNYQHMRDAIMIGKASAVAAGSFFVYHGVHRAVLINYPTREELGQLFAI